MPTSKKTDKSLEECLARLDDITRSLSSDLPLDEALKLYEEGINLIRVSERQLKNAEKKIEVLSKEETAETNDDENK